MKLFLRYILGDILKIFFSSLILMTIVLLLVFVVKEAMKQGLPFLHAVQLIPYLLPELLRLAVPMTLLLATTVSFSRMAGLNEIIVTKSLGIPPWQLLWPVWVLALIFSFLCVWLNDFAVSWGRTGMTRVVFLSLEDTIYSKLRQDGTNTFTSGKDVIEVSVDAVDGKRLISPVITYKNDHSTLKASEAEINIDFNTATLTLSLSQSVLELSDGTRVEMAPRVIPIPIPNIGSTNIDEISPSDMAMSQMSDQTKKCYQRIETLHKEMASVTAFSLLTGDFDALSSGNWAMYNNQLNDTHGRLQRLQLEPSRRWSGGFSCFFFVWVGAPLAIRLQRADIFASFFACFLPILIVYYPFLMVGIDGAKSGTLPPSSVWVGNLILGAIGYWLLKQIHKN